MITPEFAARQDTHLPKNESGAEKSFSDFTNRFPLLHKNTPCPFRAQRAACYAVWRSLDLVVQPVGKFFLVHTETLGQKCEHLVEVELF